MHAISNLPGKEIISKVLRVVRRGRALGRRELDLKAQWVGSQGYGSYAVCPKLINSESIVYSCGIGEDITFDLGVITLFGARVYAFDPTPRSIAWLESQKLPDKFSAYPYALGAQDTQVKLFSPRNPTHISHSICDHAATSQQTIEVPMFRLGTLMQKFGHTKIDVLKLDIEGAEYAVLDDIAREALDIKQIAVEFHHRFRGIGKARTRAAIETLRKKGYRILEVSEDGQIFTFVR